MRRGIRYGRDALCLVRNTGLSQAAETKLFLLRTHRPAVVVYHTSLFRGVPGGMEPVFHLLFELNDTLYYLLTCVIWSLISYFINRQEQVLGSLTPRSHQDVETAPENEENPHQFTLHLHRIFEEEHLYLNPKLTIMDLAQAIGTNRTYISNYLNNVLGTTFFDYVNQYRLSYAEQLLRQTKMSIEEIADRSGFNSRSTFRRAFLKRFGCTPSHYRLQHLPKEIEKEISLTQ